MNNLSKIAIIYNPTKDFKKVKLYIKLIKEKREDIQFDILYTDNFEDIENKAHMAINKGCDISIAAGGDGTVLGVMNAAIKHNIPFSIIPLGTGNDFAKSLSIFNIQDAVNAFFKGKIKNTDAGICTFQTNKNKKKEMYFCSTAGVGVLARVFSYEKYLITKILKNIMGNAVWPLLTVISIFSSKNTETELVLNKNKIKTQMKLFEISKVPVAGEMYFTPYAGTENGIFDAWMLHGTNAVKSLDVFMKADKPDWDPSSAAGYEYFTSMQELNRYGFSNITDIFINPAKALPVHLNGDIIGFTPCNFKILPKKIKVLY